ncbi:MAG: DUF333 domain-containing protein [Gammaproteobacteria bacterium]|nr:DUF333 domain-containing protein [Gammaproteobacteria bacterium]MBU1722551.1 DUF333 domain-containing protein [Gammaproteobacteria bacterium]MBU2004452.1 DUF333 domain-containing protein [Gammaproteobacteria bacterium]
MKLNMAAVALAVLNLHACTVVAPAIAPAPKADMTLTNPAIARAANPASMNCIQQKGTLQIERNAQGEIAYCLLPSGKRCEEWDMFRGNCPTRTVNVGLKKFGF